MFSTSTRMENPKGLPPACPQGTPSEDYGPEASKGFPSPVPVFPTMSSLIPQRRLRPCFLCLSACDVDFVHKVRTRPPRYSSRGYLCVHVPARQSPSRHAGVWLRPGCLRSILSPEEPSGQITLSSRSTLNRFQFNAGSSPSRPTRTGTVWLGTHLKSINFSVSTKSFAVRRYK